MSITASSTSLTKLEPYLLLAKNARGAAAAKLVQEATASPGCYVFQELLESDSIADLANDPQHAPTHRMLELFAYGDMMQYSSSSPGTYPILTEAHINKLRHLTLVSLAMRSRSLSYATIFPALGLGQAIDQPSSQHSGPSSASANISALGARHVRELEDTIIDAIYAGVLSGRLDQTRQHFEVDGVLGRDVRCDPHLEQVASSLSEWSEITNHLLGTLSARIEQIRKTDQERIQARQLQEEEMRAMLLQLATNQPSGHLGAIGGGSSFGARYDRMGTDKFGEMMEVDEDQNGKKKKALTGRPQRSKRTRA